MIKFKTENIIINNYILGYTHDIAKYLNVFDMAKEYDNMNDDTIDDLFMDQEEVKPAETDNTVNEVKNNEERL